MKKTAVYGGSFDPPHKGHILLAKNLAKECGAEKVIIMPAALSPFKNSSSASPADRLNMCRLAFKEPIFEVSDIEINRGGKSYTIDTLEEVKRENPDSELYLFMGDDMFLSFDKWYRYRDILKICTVVCACRTENKDKLQSMKDFSESVLKADEKSVIISEETPFEISSTELRGLSPEKAEKYLDGDVFDYIMSKELYFK